MPSLFAVLQHVLGILNVTVKQKFPHVANHSYFIIIKLESPPKILYIIFVKLNESTSIINTKTNKLSSDGKGSKIMLIMISLLSPVISSLINLLL